MDAIPVNALLRQAETGLATALQDAAPRDRTLAALRLWLSDPALDTLSPGTRAVIADAIRDGRWQDLLNTFQRAVRFGTAGIRGLMAFDKASLLRLRDAGPHAPILKGPNTFNIITLLLAASGVARYGLSRETPFSRIVIGHDTRVCSEAFARETAGLFLAHGYTVFLFEGPSPYPETGFAVTRPELRADLGFYVTSSHNDYRYNGFKLLGSGGAQVDVATRNAMYDGFIAKSAFADIRRLPLEQAPPGRLIRLGEEAGAGRLAVHPAYRNQLLGFLSTARPEASPHLSAATCAYHGSGRGVMPRLLEAAGYGPVRVVTGRRLNEPDGLFPAFGSEPGREQQPDPGDDRAAAIVLDAFREDFPDDADTLDVLIGTDPDADRCGVVTAVPPAQQALYGGPFTLMMANDLWTLLLWFRLHRAAEAGRLDAAAQFITLSHVTQESLVKVAQKFGLGAVKTWVGFPSLAAGTRAVWDLNRAAGAERGRLLESLATLRGGHNAAWRDLAHPDLCACADLTPARAFNAVTCEQSNGFSIMGTCPANRHTLGAGGHVPDKDGLLAGLLAAEAAAWGKARGLTLIDMLDRCVYADPAIGLFVGGYEPDPMEGEYPGIEGDRIKLRILARALEAARVPGFRLGGRTVTSATVYRTGRYDAVYPPSDGFAFPDEGVRFFLDNNPLCHITVRPSGTGNSLRFYQQLHEPVTEANLVETKAGLMRDNRAILDDLRIRLGAPRNLA